MREGSTLVIPTYNRPSQLGRLLNYLEQSGAGFPVLVLDSSLPPYREQNQNICEKSSLELQRIEYDSNIKPFDKFAEGVSQVKTPFCQLCADDDLVLVPGIEACLEFLQNNASFTVAHGYYFMFKECEVQGGMDIPYTLYHAPSYEDKDPIVRLHQLFRNYQALTYGMYRTTTLQHIFSTIRSMDKILSRELLGSALAVVSGKVARLPLFTHGRSMGASEHYQYWHPLEWWMKDPKSLCLEYKAYANILTKAILNTEGYVREENETLKLVDQIHLFYLIRHAPSNAYDFLLHQLIQGKKLDNLWNDPRVIQPLQACEYLSEVPVGLSDNGQSFITRAKEIRKPSLLVRILRRFLRAWGALVGSSKRSPMKPYRGTTREYRLHDKFLQPDPKSGMSYLQPKTIQQLVFALDKY